MRAAPPEGDGRGRKRAPQGPRHPNGPGRQTHRGGEAKRSRQEAPGREEAGETRSRRGNRGGAGSETDQRAEPAAAEAAQRAGHGGEPHGPARATREQPRTTASAERGPADDEATAHPSAGRTRRATRPKGTYGQARGRTGGGGEAPATGPQATGTARRPARLPKKSRPIDQRAKRAESEAGRRAGIH